MVGGVRALVVTRSPGPGADSQWEHRRTVVPATDWSAAWADPQAVARPLLGPPDREDAGPRVGRAADGRLLVVAALPGPAADGHLDAVASLLSRLLDRSADAVLSRRLTTLKERARIAALLHGGVTQAITDSAIRLDLLDQAIGDPEKMHQTLQRTRTSVLSALEQLRAAIFELTPWTLNDLDLPSRLAHLASEFDRRTGLRVKVNVGGEPRLIPAEPANLLLSCAHEALTNVHKHARVEEARLDLSFAPGQVTLTVLDAGGGFVPSSDPGAGDPEGAERSDGDATPGRPAGGDGGRALGDLSGGQGLQLLRALASLMGGALLLRSVPDEGTSVVVTLPA